MLNWQHMCWRSLKRAFKGAIRLASSEDTLAPQMRLPLKPSRGNTHPHTLTPRFHQLTRPNSVLQSAEEVQQGDMLGPLLTVCPYTTSAPSCDQSSMYGTWMTALLEMHWRTLAMTWRLRSVWDRNWACI